MKWSWSALDNLTLISNSDAHSPANLGREANVFEIADADLSYAEIRRIIKEKDKNKFLYTIEFFPEEGKYHFDGHRACQVVLPPDKTKKLKGICPVCKKGLTIGVNHRVYQLADRPLGYQLDSITYKSLVPLSEIIAEFLGQGKHTKKVSEIYQELIKKAGSEFEILLNLSLAELSQIADPKLVLAIGNMREGKVTLSPGYDGVYGVVNLLSSEQKAGPKQRALF